MLHSKHKTHKDYMSQHKQTLTMLMFHASRCRFLRSQNGPLNCINAIFPFLTWACKTQDIIRPSIKLLMLYRNDEIFALLCMNVSVVQHIIKSHTHCQSLNQQEIFLRKITASTQSNNMIFTFVC